MLIQDFKINSKPLPRVRLHPHFACKDCQYVKQLWRNSPEGRKQIVLNGIKPCKSKLKPRYMKQVPPKKSMLEVLKDLGKTIGL